VASPLVQYLVPEYGQTHCFNVTCSRVLSLQGMVTLFVMIGLGIVFGLPFMVARNRRMRKRPGGAAAEGPLSGIAQMLDINRKRDHTN
jgi:hypothetical protein